MDGAIVINKEKGMTSRDVVNKLNHLLNTKSIGHTGTLDPIATGVLVCLVGKCTKLSALLTNHDKEYIATFKLGLLTDTLDITGKILKEETVVKSKEEINKAINSFIGTYEQEVPIYSAVKINGKKLYEYARNGEVIELPKRNVTIYDIKVIDITDEIKMKCRVSKGTYIRSLIRDIGLALGTCATMTSLERTKLGEFDIKNAYTLNDVKNGNYKIISVDNIVTCEVIYIDAAMLFKIKNGQIINYKTDKYVLYKNNGQNIALYQSNKDDQIKPLIMF